MVLDNRHEQLGRNSISEQAKSCDFHLAMEEIIDEDGMIRRKKLWLESVVKIHTFPVHY